MKASTRHATYRVDGILTRGKLISQIYYDDALSAVLDFIRLNSFEDIAECTFREVGSTVCTIGDDKLSYAKIYSFSGGHTYVSFYSGKECSKELFSEQKSYRQCYNPDNPFSIAKSTIVDMKTGTILSVFDKEVEDRVEWLGLEDEDDE